MTRVSAIFVLMIFFIIAGQSSVLAGKRSPRGYRDYGDKSKQEKITTKKPEKKQDEEKTDKSTPDADRPLQPSDILLKMLAYESSLGILDFTVDVVEVTSNPITNKESTVRKKIYFLAPTRTLTVKDGIPIYYVDQDLFQQIIVQVDLQKLPDETLDGVECYVIKMIPKDEVFNKNVKHYYLAKDDFRKIRIESVRFKSTGESIINVTDFNYHMVDGEYYLPLNSESRMYDDREFLLQTTRSTFLHWKFNTGLTTELFDKQLQGYKLYGVVK